jgi:phosphatidylethanolamine/phosphatidyl-N-methylethanolamine N-methyltransferase
MWEELMEQQIDTRETRATKNRYDRIAPVYDLVELVAEQRYHGWRKQAWEDVEGSTILEIGVGTGKNMPYYPADAHVTAIDISDKMLARARRRAENVGRDVTLQQMDVQALEFGDNSFDCAIATFVFCSVPNPVLGLRELRRVVKPGGRVVLLEHVRARNPVLGKIMDLFDPLTVRLMGPHINRETVENVRQVGLDIRHVEDLDSLGIFKLIVSVVPQSSPESVQDANVAARALVRQDDGS